MLQFKDFVPKMLSPPGFLKRAEFDSFDAAAQAAARWIENKGVRLVNIETVTLPNMHSHYEDGSTDAALHTRGEMQSSWHQFVRVWYEES